MKVLVVAGSDPSGAAGLQMDLRVLALLGVHATAVPSALTVQTPERALSWEPVSPRLFSEALRAALSGLSPGVIKIGMLGTKENARLVAEALSEFRAAVVLDPVLSASSGLPLAEPGLVEVLREGLLPRVTLLTPNLPEAEALLGRPIRPGEEAEALRALRALGPRAVLLKGGHGDAERIRDLFFDGTRELVFERERIPGTFRGTGCFLSSAVAGWLARGKDLAGAVTGAESLVEMALRAARHRNSSHIEALSLWERMAEGRRVLEELVAAAERFCSHPVRPLIPEVQSNLAYALPYAREVSEVAAFPGRIVAYGETARIVGCPRFGASSHVARIVLSAMRFDPSRRAAMNIRYDPAFLEKARRKGLRVAFFSRSEEPPEVKRREGGTLSWAVTTVCRRLGYVPDLIADEGDLGKEPMIRVLARNPGEIVDLVLDLL